jgi:hypothetical protein
LSTASADVSALRTFANSATHSAKLKKATRQRCRNQIRNSATQYVDMSEVQQVSKRFLEDVANGWRLYLTDSRRHVSCFGPSLRPTSRPSRFLCLIPTRQLLRDQSPLFISSRSPKVPQAWRPNTTTISRTLPFTAEPAVPMHLNLPILMQRSIHRMNTGSVPIPLRNLNHGHSIKTIPKRRRNAPHGRSRDTALCAQSSMSKTEKDVTTCVAGPMRRLWLT